MNDGNLLTDEELREAAIDYVVSAALDNIQDWLNEDELVPEAQEEAFMAAVIDFAEELS